MPLYAVEIRYGEHYACEVVSATASGTARLKAWQLVRRARKLDPALPYTATVEPVGKQIARREEA